VLKIKRGATKNEVSAAFRKEMLKHHPDTQSSASEAEKTRAVERAKYISEAYRKIKTEMKR
jgi:DnaJ-class molecular chaperone